MSAIDDIRKLLQDLVTPDLKALEARFKALEAKMDLRFSESESKADIRFRTLEDTIDVRFKTLEDKVDLRFKTLEDKVDVRFKTLDDKLDARFKHSDEKIELKFDLMSATMAANQSAIMRVLDLDRRMERLESENASAKASDRPA